MHIVSVMDPKNLWCRNHTLLMARAMCEHYDVTILTNGAWPLTADETAFFPVDRAPDVRDIYEYFAMTWRSDDFLLYQLGNNDNFQWIAECFVRRPGVVLMHDISLFWLLSRVTGLCDTFVEEEVGITAALMLKQAFDWDRIKLAMMAVHGAYFNRSILQYATGIITHSPYQASIFAKKFPDVPVNSLALVPNFLHPIQTVDQREGIDEMRAQHGVESDAAVFGVMGFQAFHKRLPELLGAFCELDADTRVKIFLVGKWDDQVRTDCARSLAELDRRGWVTVVDRYVPEEELETYIAMCDIVTNFRYPTAGESSGIACQVLSMGVPLMVNTIGSFVDLPEQSVIRVPFSPTGDDKTTIADALRELLSNPTLLKEKQQAARANVEYYRMPRYQREYIRIIASQLDGYADRLQRKTAALAIRWENDDLAKTGRTMNAHIAIVFDELGNGVIFENSLYDGPGLLNLFKRTFASSRTANRDRLAFVRASSLAEGGRLFNIFEDDIDFSTTSYVAVAPVPAGKNRGITAMLQRLISLPIGARLCIQREAIELLAAASDADSHMRGKSAKGYLKLLLSELKYPAEISIYRHGYHALGDIDMHGKSYVIIRKGFAGHPATSNPALA